MSANTFKNLVALREEMKRYHIDATIVTSLDAHHSEYISDHWKSLEWLTGFNTSNGTAVITATQGKVWTDSRYFLQCEMQLVDSGFEMMKEDVPGEPTVTEWLAENLEEGALVAIDGTLFSINATNRLEVFCGQNGFRLATDFAPFDKIWAERPARPDGKIFIHDEKYAGEGAASKIAKVLDASQGLGADATFIAALDEVAWTLNLRCDDILFTPALISYLYLSHDRKILFVDDTKLTPEVADYLKALGVEVEPYDRTAHYLSKLDNHTVLVDPDVVSDAMASALGNCALVYAKSPIALLKAVKNDVQIEGFRNAMLRDGVALVKAFKKIEELAPTGSITEYDAWEMIKAERAKSDMYRGESFYMAAGYRSNGAIVHYEPSPDKSSKLGRGGLLLCDCGAQYLDGTTDITRTISLGDPTPDEIHDYTLVLKGHLAIATQLYPVGTFGCQLDALARQFMWKDGIAYLHGTGHGVGHFLGVHEGPQNIRLNYNPTPLTPGMVLSNEPGIYKAGKYGIRTENCVLVVPALHDDEFGDFLKMETLTLFPYDASLIDLDMLTQEEIDWVNAYHERVFNSISPFLTPDEAEWLKTKTKKIVK